MLFQRRPLRCPAPCSLAKTRRASRDDAFATAPFEDFMISSTLSHLQVKRRTQYLTHCLGRSSSAVPVFVSPPAPGMMRATIAGEFVAMGEPVERIPLAGSSCRERRWAIRPLATLLSLTWLSATCNFPPHPRYDGRTDPAARISRDGGSPPFRPFGRRIVRLTSIYWSRQSDRRRHIRDYRPQCAQPAATALPPTWRGCCK